MTNKFKFRIGDRVTILPYPGVVTFGHAGETAVVMDNSCMPFIKLDKPCTINGEGSCQADYWSEEFLELVEPITTTGLEISSKFYYIGATNADGWGCQPIYTGCDYPEGVDEVIAEAQAEDSFNRMVESCGEFASTLVRVGESGESQFFIKL